MGAGATSPPQISSRGGISAQTSRGETRPGRSSGGAGGRLRYRQRMGNGTPHGLRRVSSASLAVWAALAPVALVALVGLVALATPACSDEPTTIADDDASTGGPDPDGGPVPSAAPTGTTPPGPTGTTPPGPPNPPGPPATEPSDPALKGIVAAHNAARAAVVPAPSTPLPPMEWSESDAAVAKAYAAKCVFAHNAGRGPRGENLYANSGGTKTPAAVVGSWVSEAKNYNYATNICVGVCGHYTQVVWRDSVKLGCAMQRCTTGSPFGSGAWDNWVCDYSPAGNNGRKPY